MKYIALAALLILGVASLDAQQMATQDSVTVKSVRYFYSLRFGVVFCKYCDLYSKVSPSLTIVNGVRLGETFSVGISTGYISYGNLSVLPLYGVLSADLLGKKNKLFAELGLGSAKMIIPKYARGDYGYKDAQGKYFLETAIGYAWVDSKVRVSFLTGFQFFRGDIRYDYPNVFFLDGRLQEMEPNRRKVQFDASRLFVSIGVGLK